jgi:hypothetical protein
MKHDLRRCYTNAFWYQEEVGGNGKCEAMLLRGIFKAWSEIIGGLKIDANPGQALLLSELINLSRYELIWKM